VFVCVCVCVLGCELPVYFNTPETPADSAAAMHQQPRCVCVCVCVCGVCLPALLLAQFCVASLGQGQRILPTPTCFYQAQKCLGFLFVVS